jgi:hypothetical protein
MSYTQNTPIELTLANVNPKMAELKPLAADSLAAAEREIAAQWLVADVASFQLLLDLVVGSCQIPADFAAPRPRF